MQQDPYEHSDYDERPRARVMRSKKGKERAAAADPGAEKSRAGTRHVSVNAVLALLMILCLAGAMVMGAEYLKKREKAEEMVAARLRAEAEYDALVQRHSPQYSDLIRKYAAEYDLEPSFVAGVICVESRFSEEAVSRAGARGLMQIMPATGEEIAEALGVPFHVEDLFEPETSIRFGCYYLRQQLDRFDQNAAVALAAYNAGPNKAAQWLSEYGLDSKGRIAYIPYEETKNYVNRVLQAQENYQNLYPDVLAGGTEE